MSIYETHARVGPTGVLTLELPVGVQAANREVKVIVEAVDVPNAEAPNADEIEQWRAHMREVLGSIDDPTFFRHPQGEYEVRDEMFP